MILFLSLLFFQAPPYYKNPVDAVKDLALLQEEVAGGKASADEWHTKIQLYTGLNELQNIPQLISLLAETFPSDPVFLEAKMILLSQDKKYSEARLLGEQILEKNPSYLTIRTNLARVCFLDNQPARGLNLLIQALEIAPIRVEDWELLLKHLALANPDPEKMLASMRQKIAANPQLNSLKYVLIVVLTRFGKYEEARELLLQYPALAEHPDLQLFIAHFSKK